ncbi:MAG: DUF2961 domain-containing protein [Candidatus Hydrogenedentes bacterium]|nr:DUF2961 domain-containing protein [Candidatus Hydrogenedentota bacterium]
MRSTRLMVCALLSFVASLSAQGDAITFDSLLSEMIDRDQIASLPRVPYRSLQASSYHRDSKPPRGSEGWFADSDGVGFIRKEGKGAAAEWVIMEHDGPGCLTRMWTPYFYYQLDNNKGPTIRIYLDGNEEPVIEENFIELLTKGDYPEAPPRENSLTVPEPFAAYTARAGDLYLPIPFAHGCKITLDDTPFYYIVNYRAYPEGTQVETFTMSAFQEAKETLARVGAELKAPTPVSNGESLSLKTTLKPGAHETLELPPGPAAICSLIFRLAPSDYAQRLRSTVLRMTFDGDETVWVPLGDFFCSGNAVNPFHAWEREVAADGTMICRWVMPYARSAQVTLEHLGPQPVEVNLEVRTGAWDWNAESMHFHARWRADDPVPGTPFQDWNFVDIEGQGVYVGDNWTILSADTGWWGEGDEKIYIDDDYETRKFPSHFGTGTEDYYGWAGGRVPTGKDVFSLPFIANVRVGNPENPRGYNICMRTRVLDAIPFNKRLRFDMEASFGTQMRNPWDLLLYSVVTCWYAVPGASHNRPPQPDWASRPVMTVEELDGRQKAIRDAAS